MSSFFENYERTLSAYFQFAQMDLARAALVLIRVLRTFVDSIAKNLHKLKICLRFYSGNKKLDIHSKDGGQIKNRNLKRFRYASHFDLFLFIFSKNNRCHRRNCKFSVLKFCARICHVNNRHVRGSFRKLNSFCSF